MDLSELREIVELAKQHARQSYDPRLAIHPNDHETLAQHESRDIGDELEDIILTWYRKAYAEVMDEVINWMLYGNMAGEPRGILNDPAFAGAPSPLLLHRVPAQSARVLPEPEWTGWSEEAFRVQVLRGKVPVQVPQENR